MSFRTVFSFVIIILSSAVYSQCHKTYPLVENGQLKIYNAKGGLIKGPFIMAAPDESFSYDRTDNEQTELIYNKVHFPAMVSQNGKWGLVNEDGNFVTSLIADSLQYYYMIDSLTYVLIIHKNGKMGAYDGKGKQICPVIFDAISVEGNCLGVTVGEKQGAYSLDGKKLLDTLYENIRVFTYNNEDQLFVVNEQGCGIYSVKKNSWELPQEYQYFSFFDYPTYGATSFRFIKNNKNGIMDKDLKIVLPAEYDEISGIGPNSLFVRQGSYSGIFDLRVNKMVAWLEASSITTYQYGSEAYFQFEKNGKTGLIDSIGKVLIEPFYASFSNGIYRDASNSSGIFEPEKGILTKAMYDRIDEAYLGSNQKRCFLARKGEDQYILDDQGNVKFKMKAISCEKPYWTSENIFEFTSGKAKVIYDYDHSSTVNIKYDDISGVDSFWINYQYKGKSGKYNRKNPKSSVAPIDNLSDIREGILFKSKGKWGLMDQNKVTIIPAEYDSIISSDTYWFYEKKYLFASKDNKWGVINQNHQVIIPFKFEYLNTIGPEFFIADINGELFFTDNKGNILHPEKLDTSYQLYSLSYWDSTYTIVKDGLYGRCKFDGTIFIEPVYSSIGEFYMANLSVAIKDGKYGALHSSGKVVIPFIYDYISEFFYDNVPCSINGKDGSLDTLGNLTLLRPNTGTSAYWDCDGIITADQTIIGYTDSTGKIITKINPSFLKVENAGEVSENVCLLTNLESYCNIGNDWDYGFSLPECFYDLKKLKHLKILNSDFETFSGSIANLQSLESIEVTSHTFNSIPSEIGQLKKLQRLSIKTGAGLNIPTELGALNELHFLSLDCGWNTTFPTEILQLKKLDTLIVSNIDLPADLSSLNSLDHIEISIKPVPYQCNVQSLKILDVWLDSNLQNWNRLKVLAVEYNSFENDNNPWITFMYSMTMIPNLETLDFSNSNTYSVSMFAYCTFEEFILENSDRIKGCVKLKTIITPNNNPVSDETKALFPEIQFVTETTPW